MPQQGRAAPGLALGRISYLFSGHVVNALATRLAVPILGIFLSVSAAADVGAQESPAGVRAGLRLADVIRLVYRMAADEGTSVQKLASAT